MESEFKIRPITIEDAQTTLSIYKYYVDNTIISFEYEAPSLVEWTKRITTNTEDYPWLVCEHKGSVVGYAYGSRHRYRTAYSWSPESTVYVAEGFHRAGIGRVLYEALFELMKLQGYVNVYAGVGLPNIKSETFHQALGFYEIGIFKKIGFKHGAWHDTRWFQLHLTEHPDEPAFPKKLADVIDTEAFNRILDVANDKLNR